MQVSPDLEEYQAPSSGQMLSITKRDLREIKCIKFNLMFSMANVFFPCKCQKRSYSYNYIVRWGWDLAQQSSQPLIAVSKLRDSQTPRLSWEAATNGKEALKHLNLL